MLKNDYLVAKIGVDTAENELPFHSENEPRKGSKNVYSKEPRWLQDTTQSTLLKQNKEGCGTYPCNGYSVAETLQGYPGTCGNSGTRTGGAQSRHFFSSN